MYSLSVGLSGASLLCSDWLAVVLIPVKVNQCAHVMRKAFNSYKSGIFPGEKGNFLTPFPLPNCLFPQISTSKYTYFKISKTRKNLRNLLASFCFFRYYLSTIHITFLVDIRFWKFHIIIQTTIFLNSRDLALLKILQNTVYINNGNMLVNFLDKKDSAISNFTIYL